MAHEMTKYINQLRIELVDVQLNNNNRLISGTIKSIQLQWLPVLANIAHPSLDERQLLSANW
jgi:hypothetical protein